MDLTKKPYDNRSLKGFAIDVLETAYVNLLQTLWGVNPNVVEAQIDSEINPIYLDCGALCRAYGWSVFAPGARQVGVG